VVEGSRVTALPQLGERTASDSGLLDVNERELDAGLGDEQIHGEALVSMARLHDDRPRHEARRRHEPRLHALQRFVEAPTLRLVLEHGDQR
jgi:hypothetical protein